METSFLSSQIRRTGEALKSGAENRISDYDERLKAASPLYKKFLADLLVTEFGYSRARDAALKFFGTEAVKFAAVDGTEYARPLFDLIVFFGGAYVATGTIKFRQAGPPTVEYEDGLVEGGRGLSSCVPMYVNEVLEAEPSLRDTNALKPLDDRAIFDNTRIADWIMAFAEFYLAYKLVAEQGVQILLMDRSISGELSALISDTSVSKRIRENCALSGYEVDGRKITWQELIYGRHRIVNEELGLPSPRGDYLRYAILYLLEKRGPLSAPEVCTRLGIQSTGVRARVQKLLNRMAEPDVALLKERNEKYGLSPDMNGVWDRLKALTRNMGERLFVSSPKPGDPSPMMIKKAGLETWLTTLDIALLTLFCLYMIIEECWERNTLLIGLTKDTAARDFRRQALVVCTNTGIWDTHLEASELERVPNTDRMLLQSVSLLNHERLPVPWALVEYDTAFKTIVPELSDKPRRDFVSGAVQNRIGAERLFLKSYIQLAQAESDPKLRSNVLLMDRLVYPGFDFREDTFVDFGHEYGGVEERVRVLLFKNKGVVNEMQNLAMSILISMTASSIPEAFGHNKPLFIADNVAKWHFREFKSIVDTARQWIMANHKLRDFVFYMSTFRERRSEFEETRRRA